ncbi:hypothetical protein FHS34_001997 [Streptomyces echinatus]|uniref:Uncharacterized protein n=1 Tax=Streptomyces echinatus TaxID=67293 RepID=A0A7W9PRN0_9ACTN|nr:hypothetical protein [Streptomyces echinatus]
MLPTARAEPASSTFFARMESWKFLRDCRLKGDGVHHAMLRDRLRDKA